MQNHTLSTADFHEICTGPASRQSIGNLKESQYSLRRLRLLALFDRLSESPDHKAVVEILMDVDSDHPDVTAGVLLHPSAGVWLVRALRASSEHDYLKCLAVAAAIQAKVSFEIDVPVRHGVVHLPTVGTVPVPGRDSTTIRGVPAGLVPAIWHQTVANGISLGVHIEDSDPYREFADPQPPRLLTGDQETRWRRLLDDAWQILARRHPAYAHELSEGLRTLAPIASRRNVAGASSRAAFGGLALSAKDTPVQLAEVLVHELQHSKLNAVLDMFPLAENDAEERWYAPWRSDPRPLTGVLHGIYAFSSVVEFWNIEREFLAGPDERRMAEFEFAYRRHQVREAVQSVRSASELTERGQDFVEAADRRVEVAEQAKVAGDILDAVTRKAREERAAWLERNGS